jgi:hypothetical protein
VQQGIDDGAVGSADRLQRVRPSPTNTTSPQASGGFVEFSAIATGTPERVEHVVVARGIKRKATAPVAQ